jgi:hypothetical protein
MLIFAPQNQKFQMRGGGRNWGEKKQAKCLKPKNSLPEPEKEVNFYF